MPNSPNAKLTSGSWNTPFPHGVYSQALSLFYEGSPKECITVLRDEISSGHPCVSSITLGQAYTLLCCSLLSSDQYKEASTLFEQAVAESSTSQDANILRCWFWFYEGRYAEIKDAVISCLSEPLESANRRTAELYYLLTAAYIHLGQYDDAEKCADICFALFQLFHVTPYIAKLANVKGIICMFQGRFTDSIKWYECAAAINSESGFRRNLGDNRLNIGIALYKIAKLQRSMTNLSAAAEIYSEQSSEVNLIRANIAKGNVNRLLDRFVEARKSLTQAYSHSTKLMLPREESLSLEFLGDVYRDEGNPAEARRYYARGMAIAMQIAPEGDLVMELKRREGECLVLEGQVAAALPVLAEARRHAAKLGDRFEEGVTVRCLGEAMLAIRDHVAAQRYAEEACEILGGVEARLEHLVARIVAIKALLGRSENVDDELPPRDLLDQAWEHALAAQSLAREIDVERWADSVKRLQSRIAKRRVEEAKYAAPAERSGGDGYGGKGVVVAESRAMKEVLQAIEAFAPYDEALLITGETGTGKEIVARRVHEMSTRANGNFVAVNVTAVPTSMFEREFFGHRRGAFSGADSDREGYAAEANGGTLFLDEIGDMARETQAKLLRLLQDGSYTILGNPDEQRTDLRVIAATNIDLEDAVAAGRFREDLYYRLRILEINIPPLRKHPEDVVPLLEHFLSQSAGRRVLATDYFNRTSLALMQRYPWPGNAREVAMVARRAYITFKVDGKVLVELGSGRDALVLSGPGREAEAAAGSPVVDAGDLSRARLMLALEETGGNRTEAARLLGISRAALYRRLERYGLD